MSATWEEARKCPKCGLSGEPRGGAKPSLRVGVKLINVFCTNVMCTWDQTSWVVQINEDGSIPDAAPAGQPRGEKQFGSELYLPSSTTNKWVDDANVRAAGMDNPGVKELGSG